KPKVAARPASSEGQSRFRILSEGGERGCVRRTSRSAAEYEDVLSHPNALLPAQPRRLGLRPTSRSELSIDHTGAWVPLAPRGTSREPAGWAVQTTAPPLPCPLLQFHARV